jgi:tRNA pseudouridine55 synthase
MSAGGVLLINKPRGITSHDVIIRMRRITGVRTVGHAGTLDPLAEGLLVVLIGRAATKQQQQFMGGEKGYEAIVHLGATSETDDAEGPIHVLSNFQTSEISKETIEQVLAEFIGESQQMPPAYSAIKLRGQKAYALARAGTAPKLTPRTVIIRKIEILQYAYPSLTISVACSKGTYIRALARDIGRALGCGAYLKKLVRTASGDFSLTEAVTLEILTPENWKSHLVKTPGLP